MPSRQATPRGDRTANGPATGVKNRFREVQDAGTSFGGEATPCRREGRESRIVGNCVANVGASPGVIVARIAGIDSQQSVYVRFQARDFESCIVQSKHGSLTASAFAVAVLL